jgi:nanoRNase/pAp phosphatase (c-di-AMP/oligoRNAs hydrolase)
MQREPDLPFVIVWQDTVEGIRLYSIRTPPDKPNAGEIAESMGGGGHAHSAGFKLPIKVEILSEFRPIHSPVLSNSNRPSAKK